jgi:hypothetical protein
LRCSTCALARTGYVPPVVSESFAPVIIRQSGIRTRHGESIVVVTAAESHYRLHYLSRLCGGMKSPSDRDPRCSLHRFGNFPGALALAGWSRSWHKLSLYRDVSSTRLASTVPRCNASRRFITVY